ncbi:hypothetical protein EMIT0P253_70190 [Pseudomonas sp. IT-P253]|jgi:hypothetical protein|uniref:hypothetical protein n=1 Tax=Pseudomonas sp. IT-P253 TaxID=3026455 RepID=UPI0039E0C9B7
MLRSEPGARAPSLDHAYRDQKSGTPAPVSEWLSYALVNAVIIGLFGGIQRPDCAGHQRQRDDLSGIARYPCLAVA